MANADNAIPAEGYGSSSLRCMIWDIIFAHPIVAIILKTNGVPFVDSQSLSNTS